MSKKIKLDTMDSKPEKPNKPKLATVTGTSPKETIYIDVDDEITAIIEKVKAAKGKIIALVLPKRAAMLQSVVNMKLLKKTSADAGKNLVLVTTEANLLPLAGLAGLHVAETPTSRPVVPPQPDAPSGETESIDEPLEVAGSEFDAEKNGTVPIGELASAAGVAAIAGDIEEEIVMGDDDARPSVKPVKRNRGLKVPSFNKFRLWLVLGGVFVVLLIVGTVYAARVLPEAKITIDTDSQVLNSKLTLTLDTAAQEVDTENKIIPAQAQTLKKTYSQSVDATGEVNNGDRATGTVVLTASDCTLPTETPSSIPTGSSVSRSGYTYITQEQATFSDPQLNSDGSCIVYTSNEVEIRALKGGAAYNASDASFTGPNATTGTGSASGGTDDITKIVLQEDIDSAKDKAIKQDTAVVSQDLEQALEQANLLPIAVTLAKGAEEVTSSAEVGDAADKVTVTVVVPYTMLGVEEADVSTIVTDNINEQIDTDKQKILDDGVANATFTTQDDPNPTSAIVSMTVDSIAGPELDTEAIKKNAVGKKSSEVTSTISDTPGVTNVEVEYSPFWVTTVPSNLDKITVEITQPKSGS